MTNTLYRVSLGSLIACFALFAFHVSAQSPPTATEAFNLRIKCKKMSDKKAQESIDINMMAKWEFVAAWNTSKYDAASNRCYGRFYQHIVKPNYHLDHDNDTLYDLQIDDLLAAAIIENGKKRGSIFDENYKKPWLPSCSAKGCPPDFGDQTWQAAKDYMNEMMAEARKQ